MRHFIQLSHQSHLLITVGILTIWTASYMTISNYWEMSNNSSQSLEKIKKSKVLRFFYGMLNKVELISEQENAKNKKSKPMLLL